MLFVLCQNATAPFRRNVRNADGVPIRALNFNPREPADVAAEDVRWIQKDVVKGTLIPCTVNTFGKPVLKTDWAKEIAAAAADDVVKLVTHIEAKLAAMLVPAESIVEGDQDAPLPPDPPLAEDTSGESSDEPPNDNQLIASTETTINTNETNATSDGTLPPTSETTNSTEDAKTTSTETTINDQAPVANSAESTGGKKRRR